MNEVLVNNLKRILFSDNEKMYVGYDNRIFLTNEAFDMVISAISEVPLFNGYSLWPSLKDCIEYQGKFSLFNVILYYLWLQETNKTPRDSFQREVSEYIDAFITKHLVVLNEGENLEDYINSKEKQALPIITIPETLYKWSLEYITENVENKLSKDFPSKKECVDLITTANDFYDASDIETAIRLVCYFVCYYNARSSFSTINKRSSGFMNQYISENLVLSKDNEQHSYFSYMYKQGIIEVVKELNNYAVQEKQVNTINIYFTNNRNWSSVNVYWASEVENNRWPGTKMNYVKTNDMGEDIYSLDIPANVKLIVFCSENGYVQTVDITNDLVDGKGFYLTHNYNGGKYEIGTYDFYKEG